MVAQEVNVEAPPSKAFDQLQARHKGSEKCLLCDRFQGSKLRIKSSLRDQEMSNSRIGKQEILKFDCVMNYVFEKRNIF